MMLFKRFMENRQRYFRNLRLAFFRFERDLYISSTKIITLNFKTW